MTSRSVARIETIWDSLCEDKEPPKRSAISAPLLGDALPYGFILEQPTQGASRFRLVGEKVIECAGIDLIAMPFTGLFEGASRPVARALAAAVFNDRAILEITFRVQNTPTKGLLRLFPLKDQNGRKMALGGFEVIGSSVSAAGRLSILDSTLRHDRLAKKTLQYTTMPALTKCPEFALNGGQLKKPDALRPVLKLVKSAN
ncbi:MAG: PAS domain-containing protein [Pseudoruegeria sp.]